MPRYRDRLSYLASMRRRLVAHLDRCDHDQVMPDANVRAVGQCHSDALAELMLAAYRGTIDDAGETIEDAKTEVRRLFDGTYGAFDFSASEAVVHDDILISATLVTHYDGAPLIAFSMTHPDWQRRGLARAGLRRAMGRLRAAGATQVRLAVTAGNAPAELLYESLGFRDS
jgi:ribosomal protein S18 acetylase RimI-like enzyme